MRGYLFDVHPVSRSEVSIWMKMKNGIARMEKIRWMPKIYVAGPLDKLVQLSQILSDRYRLNFVEKSMYPGRSPETVLEIETPFGEKQKIAREILDIGRHQFLRVFNVDLPSMQEFLYYYDLYPTALIEYSTDRFKFYDRIGDLDYDTSWLNIAYLNVKKSSNSMLPSFRDKLIEAYLKVRGERIVLDSSEEFILEELTRTLDSLNIDVVVTDGGDSFLIPYLYYRSRVNNVKLRLGRMEHEPKLKISSRSYFSYGRIYHKFKGFKLRGRIHIDSSNSMLYRESGIEGLLEVSRVARIPIQDASRYTIGTCMSSLQYYEAYKLGILIPWTPAKTSYMNGFQLNKADRGGLTLDAKPGVYWNIGEIDFKSLYPMLMYKYNISGETVNCECCRSSVEIPEIGYRICSRWRGIVPRAIELPLKKRLQYKKLSRDTGEPVLREVYLKRADALKWILVTAFGYLGFKKAKFGSREAHLAVCALARDTLLKAVKIAEEEGFKVIHGIVDSLWVYMDGADDEAYGRLAKKIEKELGLPVSCEGRYKWIVFTPSKINHVKPVNNRYFGIFVDGRIKYRGIEARRRDTARIVKDMQLEMLKKLREASNPVELREKALECFKIYWKYVRKIIMGEVSVEELSITKTLSMDPRDYNLKIKHAEAAKLLEKAGVEVKPGQPVTYIYTPGNVGATPIQLIKNNTYSIEDYLRILKKAAETILNPILF